MQLKRKVKMGGIDCQARHLHSANNGHAFHDGS
jgi:hypothetical protein